MWDQVRKADEIVFVCTGNIIRSAFCDVYAHHLGFSKAIKSMGTTYQHEEIYEKTREYLKSIGVPNQTINQFHPTHISEHQKSGNSVYFVMTREHIQELLDYGYEESCIHYMREIEGTPGDILDPYYHGKLQQTLLVLKLLVEKLHRYTN